MVLNFNGKKNQSDFDESSTSSINFIKNKPVVGDGGLTEKNFTSSLLSEIQANTAKTGITSGQASAIVANTAKVGHTNTLVKSAMSSIIDESSDTITLKGDTINISYTFASPASGDVLIQRHGSTKLTLGDSLITIAPHARFNNYIAVGEPTATYNAGYPYVPLHVGTQSSVTLTGNTAASGQAPYFRFFSLDEDVNNQHWSGGQANLGGGGSAGSGNGGGISIYCEGNIITRHRYISANGTGFASDDRLKTLEAPIETATETLMKLNPKTYMKHTDYLVEPDDESAVDKDASGNIIEQYKESGLIAQSVYAAAPELSHLIGEHFDLKHKKYIMNIDYIQLIPYLIRSNQELNERIIQLESK